MESISFYPIKFKEDIDVGSLYDSVVCHPRLEGNLYENTQLPAIGQAVMFAQQLQPRFGIIAEINPTLAKPLSIMLWKPNSKAKSLLMARFKSTRNLTTGEEIVCMSPAQIKTHVTFSEDGFLSQESRKQVRAIVTRSQRQLHAKANPRSKNRQQPKPKAAASRPVKTAPTTASVSPSTRRQRPARNASAKTLTPRAPKPTHRYNTRGHTSKPQYR